MEKENNKQTDANVNFQNEIMFGDSIYLHTSDEGNDYLIGKSDNGIKMILQFTKDKEINSHTSILNDFLH